MEKFLLKTLRFLFKTLALFSPKLCAKLAWSFFCKPRIRKKALRRNEKELLQQAEHFFIDSGKYRIAVYQWASNASNGKTVLLTHGWGGHALNFSLIIKSLLENGYDVCAFDAPAHGKSSGDKTSLPDNTEAVIAVANQAKPIYALIGHSFGSINNAYAYELQRNSELFSQLEHMVLIAGPNKLKKIFANFTNAMHLPDKILNIFIKRAEALTNRSMEQMTTVDFLLSFPGNILVMHDENDPVVPFATAEEVAKGTKARLFTTSASGHSRILITQSVADEIVNTLSRSPG